MGEMIEIFKNVREASRTLVTCGVEKINQVLLMLADATETNTPQILAANADDLARMDVNNPKYDRLKLTEERIHGIAEGIRNVALLPSPVGKVLGETVRPNGMKLTKISVPFGVIGIIYEARPNVTLDVFSLCLKSGNACILKGGSDADCTNRAIVEIIRNVLNQCFFNPDIVALLPAGHDSTAELLNARGWVDLLIPRGGRGLIDFVHQHATIPVIETGAGVCHTYFDEQGDLEKGKAIIRNAKTRRVSVCNALDCLLVHWKQLENLPELCKPLADFSVTIYADTLAYEALKENYPTELLQHASEQDFGTEYLDYKMSICTSTSLQGAVDHIAVYGSGHSECIVTENPEVADYFSRVVDAACV